MAKQEKYDQILNAMQTLLTQKKIQDISVSEIAKTAGIGKGSIYYYFSSKNAILDALIERTYTKTLETAKHLAEQTDVSVFTRMAMIFQACRNSSADFLTNDRLNLTDDTEQAFLHHKFIHYLVTKLKPVLTEIICQGIDNGCIHFDYPAALAEMVLIVLTVKLDNTLVPSTNEEIDYMISGLISLIEKGTGNPAGSLNFLKI